MPDSGPPDRQQTDPSDYDADSWLHRKAEEYKETFTEVWRTISGGAFEIEYTEHLKKSSVAVIGIGDVGSLVAYYLVQYDVDELLLVDPDDTTEDSFPPFMDVQTDDIGVPKADVLCKRYLKHRQGDIRTQTTYKHVEDTKPMLDDADVIISTTNQEMPRLFLNRYSIDTGTPYIDITHNDTVEYGHVTDVQMVMQTVIPGTTACLDCIHRLDRSKVAEEMAASDGGVTVKEKPMEYAADQPDAESIFPEVSGMISAMAATQCAKLVSDPSDAAGMLQYNTKHDDPISKSDTEPDPHCPMCAPVQD